MVLSTSFSRMSPGNRESHLFNVKVLILVFLVAFVGMFLWTLSFIILSTHASGRIIGFIPFRNHTNRDTGFLIYVYTDDKGVGHRIESGCSNQFLGLSVGDKIDVLYISECPGYPMVNKPRALWGNLVIPAWFGGICIIAYVSLTRHRK